MPSAATRPAANEHLPYHVQYINLVTGDDAITALKSQLREMLAFLACLSNEETMFRYAPDKWSVREVLGHIVDTERIMAYRALRIARGDQTPLPGFEQNDYVPAAKSDHIRWSMLVEEFDLVRRANIMMFCNFPAEAWTRTGTVNNGPHSVRALAWIIAGHELHHRTILEQRYLHR